MTPGPGTTVKAAGRAAFLAAGLAMGLAFAGSGGVAAQSATGTASAQGPGSVGISLPKSMYRDAANPRAVKSEPRRVGAGMAGTTVLDAGGSNRDGAGPGSKYRRTTGIVTGTGTPGAFSTATSGNTPPQRAQSPKPLFPGGPVPNGSASGSAGGGTVSGSAGGNSAGVSGGASVQPPPAPPVTRTRVVRTTNVNPPPVYTQPPPPAGTLPNTAPPPAALPAVTGVPPETFGEALAVEYKMLIEQEAPKFRGHFRRAHFESKAARAAGGTAVAPEGAFAGGELSEGRSRLIAALDANGRAVAPALAARAQVQYDCWAERVRMGALEDDVLICRNAFFSTLMWLEDTAQPIKGGTAFNQGLAQGYLRYANVKAAEDKDFVDARFFARKGLWAGEGGNVKPELIARWNLLKDGDTPQFVDYRERLVRALDDGGRANLPGVAARAQVSFDCWVESTSEHNGPGAKRVEVCRAAFLDALGQLEGRGPTEAGYLVFFDFDSIRIKPEGRRTIRAAALDHKRRQGGRITVVGHADRSGSQAYNLGLSARRANVIKRALTRQGIPSRQIQTIARGETQPAVPTADGVRNPKNRRGQIIVP